MSKISDFLISDKGKRTVNFFYGTGAAVVILGALFKIQHWPGAGIMLSIGMCTEAFLFALSGLEPPHKQYDWSLVFPVLGYGDHSDDENLKVGLPAMSGVAGIGAGTTTAVESEKAVSLSNINSIAEDDVRKLSDGIKRLGDTAAQLNSIADASVVTNTYIKAISGASDAASAFANSRRIV
jgi:gliding motility-associated protein GldL